jgi:hypothetical protein
VEKITPQNLATSVILQKKLPKVNYHTTGENSPILVTLVGSRID